MLFENFIRKSSSYASLDSFVPAPYLRKEFVVDFTPENASVYICSTGFYVLYINGKNITKGSLAPYISNPDELCCYDEYDILPYISNGENVIGVILGNGFLNQDMESWNLSKAPFRTAVSAGIKIVISNKTETLEINGDDSFKTAASPIIFDMYRLGTHYDASFEQNGWSSPGFDDSLWDNAEVVSPPKGKIEKCIAEPITIQKELKPIKIEKQSDFCYMTLVQDNHAPFEPTRISNGYVYDFGVNCAGVCKLRIKGKKGQKIVLRHAECLHNGIFNMNSVHNTRDSHDRIYPFLQTDVYILKGTGEEVYIPSFTYHGFRYVLVCGITEQQATKELLTYEVMNSNITKRANFSCSDDTLNTLYKMGIRADLSNFHYFPTDCPHREKNGWTGDASISAEQLMLNFEATDSFKLWLKSISYAQRNDGMLPGVVPSAGFGYEWGNGPLWDGVCVNIPYYCYKFDGRLDIVKECAPMISKYLHYIALKKNENGLYEFGLGDWCQPLHTPFNISAPLVLTDSVAVYEIAMRSSFLFNVLGLMEEKRFADNLALNVRESMRKHLINHETMTAFGDCMTSQVLFLAFDIFQDNEKSKAYQKLLEIIDSVGYADCGMFGLRHIFHVLTKFGDADKAIELIMTEKGPSYKTMLDRGATSLCERFESDLLNMSENHHFFGDILNLFISEFAGLKINPNMTDVNEILIEPTFPKRLMQAEASYFSKKGKISVKWERTAKKTEISVCIPDGIHGTVKFNGCIENLTIGKNLFSF